MVSDNQMEIRAQERRKEALDNVMALSSTMFREKSESVLNFTLCAVLVWIFNNRQRFENNLDTTEKIGELKRKIKRAEEFLSEKGFMSIEDIVYLFRGPFRKDLRAKIIEESYKIHENLLMIRNTEQGIDNKEYERCLDVMVTDKPGIKRFNYPIKDVVKSLKKSLDKFDTTETVLKTLKVVDDSTKSKKHCASKLAFASPIVAGFQIKNIKKEIAKVAGNEIADTVVADSVVKHKMDTEYELNIHNEAIKLMKEMMWERKMVAYVPR